MVLSRNYIAILVAFAVGIIGAVGFTVHAQSIGSTTPNNQPQVATSSIQVSDGDDEQADDQSATDVETNDDSSAQSVHSTSTQETKETADTADTGEVEDGQ